jgi:hypothetical protein
VDYIVSARYYRRQYLDAEPFGCIAIYDQFETSALLHRQVSRFLALKDARHIGSSKVKYIS